MTPPSPVERQGDAQLLTLIRESNQMIRDMSEVINEQSIKIATLQESLKARIELDLAKHATLDHRVGALEVNQRWFIISILTLVLAAVRDLFYR